MRVFISYRHKSDADVAVADAIVTALNGDHDVFIDKVMPVGTDWVDEIETKLKQSDFLICLLSEESVASEMVGAEISTAHNLAKDGAGRPIILPVRLAYDKPFPYNLRAYLERINWFKWSGPEDTPRLIAELRRAITNDWSGLAAEQRASPASTSGQLQMPVPHAEPVPLDLPGGVVDPESTFYIERPADKTALAVIQRQGGVTISIMGPQQLGKTSLMMRTIAAAIQAQKRVAFVDLQTFDRSVLASSDQFFRQFCSRIGDALGLEDQVDRRWGTQLGASQLCRNYLYGYVLRSLQQPLVLAIDEVDRLLSADFGDDFFRMLRSWHNERALPSDTPWRRLDLILVTSTEPYQFIDNPHDSPFNVGEVIRLSDFSRSEVRQLADDHGSPLDADQEQRLFDLLGGHPYLTRRAMYLVASGQIAADQLFAHAAAVDGPFGDHLRSRLFSLYRVPDLLKALLQAIRYGTCEDQKVLFRLVGAGLVRVQGVRVLPRCQLYADYFLAHAQGV